MVYVPCEGMHFACADNSEASPLFGGFFGGYECVFQKNLVVGGIMIIF